MGNRRYYDQLIMDAAQQSKFNITDVMDVSTIRDYMMVPMLAISHIRHIIVKQIHIHAACYKVMNHLKHPLVTKS